MATKNEEFQKRLLTMFRVEAEEHLDLITAGLLDLEKTLAVDRQMTIVENIFREAHSLKGAARSVKMSEVEAFCQSLESVFAAWKGRDLDPSPELYDTLHKAVDTLRLLLAETDDNSAAALKSQIGQLGEQLVDLLRGPLSKHRSPSKNGQTYPMVVASEPHISTTTMG